MPRVPVLLITSPEQWAVITSPVRLEIMEAMRELAPCGIKVVAQRLGVRPDTLYRHMDLLQEYGYVVPAGFRKVSRATEQLFDLTADDFNISFDTNAQPGPANDMVRDTASVFMKRVGRVINRTAEARGFNTTAEGKNTTLLCDYAHFTREEYLEMNAVLRKAKTLIDAARARARDGTVLTDRYIVLLAAIPVINAPPATHDDDNEPVMKPVQQSAGTPHQ